MSILVKIFSILPLSILYFLSDLLFIIVYKILGYRKEVVRSNILKVFPDRNDKERNKIALLFYRNFCDFIVETAKALTITEETVKRRAHFENLDELHEILSKHKSVIFLTSHIFNWEWMQLSASVQFPIPYSYIYHPLHNPNTDKLMLRLRSRFGAEPIKRRETARQVIKKSKKGHGFAILGDQFPSLKDKVSWVHFLNVETAFYYGVEQVSKLLNQPVLYFHMTKPERGQYKIKMIPITLSPEAEKEGAILQKYAKAIEDNIRAQPDLYLWSHKRWKRSRQEVEALGK